MDTVTISTYEYWELRRDSNRLSALDCDGVDNWEKSDEYYKQLEEWEKENPVPPKPATA